MHAILMREFAISMHTHTTLMRAFTMRLGHTIEALCLRRSEAERDEKIECMYACCMHLLQQNVLDTFEEDTLRGEEPSGEKSSIQACARTRMHELYRSVLDAHDIHALSEDQRSLKSGNSGMNACFPLSAL